MAEAEWRRLNRANWEERVPLHLTSTLHYDQTALRAGTARLDPIVTESLGPVDGCHILHLQCHFGMDSLTLAQRGAQVTGVDFSPSAIRTAKSLASDLGLAQRAHFILSDVYEVPAALPAAARFDRVLVSWGALCWLPDVHQWARIVANVLKPGGWLTLAEAHPTAYVFDDAVQTPDGRPGWFAPYLARQPITMDSTEDYADPATPLTNSRTIEWLHPLADVITGLVEAGLRIDRFTEHDSIPWQMFRSLVRDAKGFYRWPDQPWLPLSYSLRASKPVHETGGLPSPS